MGKQSRKRITMIGLVETSGEKIKSQDFLEKARKRPQDFTRNRKLPFPKLMIFMLGLIKCSIQTALDKFFETSEDEEAHMAQQSFSEAREKIRWEAFHDLYKTITYPIYDHYYETWHGYRVSAIDGSKIQLPDDPHLREYFGTLGKNNTAATAQASALYDVYNNVLIDAWIEPLDTCERTLALRHIEELCSMASFGKELIIFDRGYPSFELIEALTKRGISFVMRVKRGFNKAIDLLSEGDHRGSVLLHKDGHDNIPLRVIRFKLQSGEEEMLITDIADKRMGAKAFKELYFKRWPIETKFDELKNKLEVENFSGRTVNAVKQDFFISMYMSNMMAVACWEAQEEADDERELKDNKYEYHVNVSDAVGSFKERFIRALLEDSPRKRRKKVRRILFLMVKSVTPTRPDRSFPRNPSPRKARFRHNRKSNC